MKAYKKKSFRVFLGIGFALLLLYTLSLFIPLLWTLFTSFKGRLEFIEKPFGFPEVWKLSNYGTVFEYLNVPINIMKNGEIVSRRDVGLAELIYNAVFFTAGCTATHTLVPCITAYAVAKYRYRFSSVVYALVIVAMVFPVVGSLPSEMQIVRALGFYDSMAGVWIMKGTFLGTNFLIYYAAFKGIPWSYAEAAEIDGASHFRIMTTIMIPLISKTVAAIGLLSFITYWNEYQTVMLYLPSSPTLSYGLYRFQFSSEQAINYVPVQLAACIVVSIFPIILFAFTKNMLMGNVALGGIKG